MKLLTVFVRLAGTVAVALVSAAPAEAQLQCGDVITEDTTLTEDLDCLPPIPGRAAIRIQGKHITLDLGGHTISGPPRALGVKIILGSKHVTIKNGTIKGFRAGVADNGPELGGFDHVTLENLVFKGQTSDSLSGVIFTDGKNVVIRDSSFIGDDEDPIPSAIWFTESRNVRIENIDATCGHSGVWARNSRNVVVKDSTFHQNGVGIFIDFDPTDYYSPVNVKVWGNHISGCILDPWWGCTGIHVGGQPGKSLSGVSVKHNFLHDLSGGITTYFTIDSEISYNHSYNNGHGIALADESKRNRIKSNITFDNDWVDLYHSEDSSPNTWKDNGYETSQGGDIPPPSPPSQLACGTVITEDTKLTGDLYCPVLDPPPVPGMRAALYIQADGVTLDLSGHTITGPEGIGAGVWAPSTEGVTIKNGKLTGFRIGVEGRLARDLELKNLLLTGQTTAGLRFGGAVGVTVKDSCFMGGEHPVTSAIRFGDSEDVSIKNIDATRCYECVFAVGENNDVEIKDSSFHDNLVSIIFPEAVSNAKISGNHISGCLDGDVCCVCPFGSGECDEDELVCSHGVRVEGGTDISIKNNFVHNVWAGITLINTHDSEISSNHVYNNLESGMVLWDGSTDNRVISNITFGTGDGIGDFDLEHSCSSSPNIWEDNSYVFCKGLEINGCTNPCN